jgi:hypothetical protein
MTVCVAALCNAEHVIVTASDSMMAWGPSMTAETSLKYEMVHPRWGCMLAGDDITPAEPIIRLTRQRLVEHQVPSVSQVEEAIRTSWRTVKNQIAETHVLSPYGITIDTFVRDGRNIFGDAAFADMCSEIARASELSCELLFYGFGRSDRGHLLHVVHPGEPVDFQRLGFAAIGSGRDSAMASLMWEPAHRSFAGTTDGTYRVCAAKFMAETAMGVGRDTIVIGIRADNSKFLLRDSDVSQIRELWETEGRPRIPKPHRLIFLGNIISPTDAGYWKGDNQESRDASPQPSSSTNSSTYQT